MDLPNAFVGQITPPSDRDVAAKLGPALATWRELIDWLKKKGIASGEWKSVSPKKYGWGAPSGPKEAHDSLPRPLRRMFSRQLCSWR